ncbi:FAD/NAD(P)-binding protein [Mucilaginibacter gilvus]|uniref:FAD/NAD(P)-binding protein n=1 Tax=Mucilaginibacter gilvus TaxID=2305909 RepID=UPI001FBA53C3|nr:FAD/NAD(P)-binding protein [Mucilaginibacter gilvus]
MKTKVHIAILGGGPSGLFMFKRLVDTCNANLAITIFERKKQLGVGMPYSTEGANDEHITNVSGNEIPELVTSIADWIASAPKHLLDHYQITQESYNDYKVLPRLLFGQYLSAQFDLLQQQAETRGIEVNIHFESSVTDITDEPEKGNVSVEVNGENTQDFDTVIICTGHNWPKKYEGKIPGYFDSPYPPAKLHIKTNHQVAIKGSSLTAVDAIRTLARGNGEFSIEKDGKRVYHLAADSPDFKITLHSRNGLLPAVRFHLDDSHLENDSLLTDEEIAEHIQSNNGFLSLDYIFEKDFKQIFKEKDPEFYAHVKDLSMETFVAEMMEQRERLDAFQLLKAEYMEAERSIKRRESIYWKEMLGVLSFAMNYPAKYLCAEDMQRLQKVLQPLISVVIAYIPQSSCEELLAMHDAGVLEIVSVGEDSEVKPEKTGGATYYYTDEVGEKHADHFKTFVDSVGQPHLPFEDLPYKSLVDNKTVSPALLKFRDAAKGKEALKKDERLVQTKGGDYYLTVPGVAINDNFQVLDEQGTVNDRIYMMAVPYIGGYNPDYSGLDFCEAASANIIDSLFKTEDA